MSGQIAIEWYISRDGQQHGPFTEGDLARFVAQGQVLDADYVWHSGLDQWKLYREYRAGPASAPAFDDHTRASSPANAPRKCSFCLFVRKVLRVPYDTLATALELLVRPTRFAQQRIDVGPRDLYRASYFWFNFFTVAFLVGSSLTHFAFYEGASELRELGMIAVQIAAAVPIIYLLNIAFRQPVRFSGVAQSVLYIDGPFLILETAVNALLAYAVFTQSLDRGELDVIGTEVERCLTGNSYVYWLVRGDLKFFTHSPFEATNLALVKEYASYGLIIPFCIVFAKLMKGRYSASVWLNMVIAVAAYAIVVNAVNYALDRAQQSIYARSSCAETAARSAFATYNSGVVTRQIGERVNRQLRNNLGTNSPSLTVQGTGFALNLQLRSSETPEETIKALSTASRSLYCANNTDMRLVRAISLPLNLTIHEAGGPKVVYQEQIVPATCTIPP